MPPPIIASQEPVSFRGKELGAILVERGISVFQTCLRKRSFLVDYRCEDISKVVHNVAENFHPRLTCVLFPFDLSSFDGSYCIFDHKRHRVESVSQRHRLKSNVVIDVSYSS